MADDMIIEPELIAKGDQFISLSNGGREMLVIGKKSINYRQAININSDTKAFLAWCEMHWVGRAPYAKFWSRATKLTAFAASLIAWLSIIMLGIGLIWYALVYGADGPDGFAPILTMTGPGLMMALGALGLFSLLWMFLLYFLGKLIHITWEDV